MLKLNIVADEGDLLSIQCEGDTTQEPSLIDNNPLEAIGISTVYRRRLLLDLARLGTLDSSGIGWLIRCNRNFKEAGGVMVLHSIPPRIHQTLLFCGMDRLLQMAGDESGARTLATGSK